MIEKLVILLQEEINYKNSILSHEKSLEASLWGLEQQASYPENSAKEEQQDLVANINTCRLKISNCRKLIVDHDLKMKEMLKKYVEGL